MIKYGIIKGIKIVILVSLAIVFFGYLVMELWNWLLPDLIGAGQISFMQALGLLVLSRLLFGGLSSCGNKKGGNYWKGNMKEKYNKMTPEEKQKFREKFNKYCGKYHCEEDSTKPDDHSSDS